MRHRKQSFDHTECENAEILILGSLPGDVSLEAGEYYANSRNRFWTLIAKLLNSPIPVNYEEKLKLIKKGKIILWDVAHTAIREGSLDSEIKDELPNDLHNFLNRNPSIKKLVFNGQKAEKMYKRFFNRLSHIEYYVLPSTSPANAACNMEKLIKSWESILK